MSNFAPQRFTKTTNKIMQGNFSYQNPTKLYFGEDALKFLSDELKAYGPTVQLCYGGGSIKRNGIYDEILKESM